MILVGPKLNIVPGTRMPSGRTYMSDEAGLISADEADLGHLARLGFVPVAVSQSQAPEPPAAAGPFEPQESLGD